MKKSLSFILVALVSIVITTLLAFTLVKPKIIWLAAFGIAAYVTVNLTRSKIKPALVLLVLLIGIVIAHIPSWISLHVKHDISFGMLVQHFFKGTNMFYSMVGTVLGYGVYKLVSYLRTPTPPAE